MSVTAKPLVSAVIANWNGSAHLRVCLPSLLAQSFPSIEIIVVDNGSKDDSVDVAREFGARWLGLEKNLGLASALNRGAAVASGEFLLFVNNDMRFHQDFVSALLEPLQADDTVFAADGMQYNWDGSASCHLATRLVNAPPSQDASVEFVPGLYFYPESAARITPVFMASAACMLAKRSLFDRLRGFDNRLPLGYEDLEVCWRAAIHGWRTVYVPNAVCWHRVGSSGQSRQGARLNFQGVVKGRLLLAAKLLPLRYAVFTWLVSAAGLAKDLSRFRLRFALDRIAILAEFLRLFPELLREKEMLFRAAGTTPGAQLLKLLQLTADSNPQFSIRREIV